MGSGEELGGRVHEEALSNSPCLFRSLTFTLFLVCSKLTLSICECNLSAVCTFLSFSTRVLVCVRVNV